MTPEERLDELRKLGKRYAEAKAQAGYLYDYRKSCLAQHTMDNIAKGANSHAAAETEARTHPDYLQVLEGLREATAVHEAAYWELRVAEWGVKIWQSKPATERAEMVLT